MNSSILKSYNRTLSRVSRIGAVAVWLAIALFSLWNTAQWGRNPGIPIPSADLWDIAGRHERYAAMSAFLDAAPGVHKELGFVTFELYTGWREALYYDAAFELAPRFVLDRIRPADFVAGSFRQPVDLVAVCRAAGLVVVRDFGGGVVLFRSARAAGRGAKQWRNPPVQPRFGGHDLRVFLRSAGNAGFRSVDSGRGAKQ